MKNYSSPLARTYFSEVLGMRNYLCPESIYSLRSLEGELPCRALAVVFESLSFSQKGLLKKIINSLNVFEYSILEVKDNNVLNQLLFSKNRWADFVCLFGGRNLLEEGLLIQQEGLLVSSFQKHPLKQRPVSFLQICPLKELDGSSPEIINKKKKVWEQLKEWKKISKI